MKGTHRVVDEVRVRPRQADGHQNRKAQPERQNDGDVKGPESLRWSGGDGGLDAPPGRARAGGSGKIPTCGLTGAVHPLHIRVELGAARRLLQGLCHRVYTRHDTFLSRLLELNCAIHPSEALSSRESRPDPTSPRTPSRNVRKASGSRGMACCRARTVRRSTWFVSRGRSKVCVRLLAPPLALRRLRPSVFVARSRGMPSSGRVCLFPCYSSVLGPIHPPGSRWFLGGC